MHEGGHPPAATVRFSTEAIAPPLQFQHWRERWAPIVEMSRTADEAIGYPATNTILELDGLAVSRVVAPALRASRRAPQIRRDQIDTWLLACARRGVVQHEAAGSRSLVEPGVPILYSMGEAFDNARSAVHWVTLFFSRDFARELNPLLEAVRNRPLASPMGRLLADFILALEYRLPEMSQHDAANLTSIVRQMLAACIAPTADRLAEAAPALDLTRRERVRLAIRRHIASPSLSPGRVGRLVGMSRSSLYRLFEADGGVARYVLMQRMRAAYAALADGDDRRPVRAVAEAVGFVDAAAFSRSFRKVFGCSPSELRESARPRGAAGDDCVGGTPRSDVLALLRRL